MNVFYIFWYIFQTWIAIYLALPLVFLLIYQFKKITHSQFDISKKPIVYKKDFDFAVIITVHKQTMLVPALLDSILKQQYEHYTIYVVADCCDGSSIPQQNENVIILQPQVDLNSKIKSIDYAIDHFRKQHDALVIFDPDNLVHPQFLYIVNQYFQKGYRAVQANLKPKNTDSVYARLDSIGDTFYNFTEREIRMELGLSSAIWGLGICIETILYKEIIYDNHLGGFDKRIQAYLAQKIPQLAFAKEAFVYDEKVSTGKALEKQRTRWIHAYFKYLKLSWKVFLHGIKKVNFNVIFFGFINLRPPFFILIFLVLISCVINYFIHMHLFITWMVIVLMFVVSFIIIVSMKSTDKRTARSIFFIPLLIFRQLSALTKIKKANKTFLKTENNKLVYIEDLLRNEPV
jgi:cellulose synthase/poly-beta-1,6-N-acetylglucosamine synthase-like glycosyltransferase